MKPKYAAFSALDPFFEVVQRGLSGLVDGEHYFDAIAKNAIFEFRYGIGGWPKRVEGRDALMARYRGYGESIVLHIVHWRDYMDSLSAMRALSTKIA